MKNTKLKHSHPPIPKDFIRFKAAKWGHYYYRCTANKFIKGEPRQCKYTIRSDKFNNYHGHEHIFEALRFPSKIESTIEKLKDNLNNAAVNLAGKGDLSLHFLRQPFFREFCFSMIDIGYSLSELSSPERLDLTDIFPIPSFYSLRSLFLTQSTQNNANQLLLMKNFGFASLVCDSGTINNVKYFDVFLCNPAEKLPAIPFYSQPHHTNTKEELKKQILAAVQKASEEEIIITGIIGDNLIAQQNAIKEITQMDIQFQSGIIRFPCLCHSINLVIHDLYKINADFRLLIDQLHSIGSVFNILSKIGNESERCPTHINTRWYADFEIAFFLLRHKGTIYECLPNFTANLAEEFSITIDSIHYFIQFELLFLCEILSKIKGAILILESDKTTLDRAFLVLQELKTQIGSLRSRRDNPVHQTVLEDFLNELYFRSSKTFNGQIIQLAFHLTLRGRADFRKSICHLVQPDSTIAFSLENPDDRKPIHLNPPKYDKYLINLDIDEEVLQAIEIETEDISPNASKDDSQNSIETENESTLDYHHDFDEREEIELMKSARALINETAPGMGLDPAIVYDQFGNWIFNSIQDFMSPQLLCQKIGPFWRRLQIASEWENLSQFARRLFSIATSEAACERGFSKRKKIQDVLRNRSKQSLISARLEF
jgi:hypothetical protein